MKKRIVFAFDRETKRTLRYKEQPEPGQPEIIGTLYVQKFFAKNCHKIVVDIMTDEAVDRIPGR